MFVVKHSAFAASANRWLSAATISALPRALRLATMRGKAASMRKIVIGDRYLVLSECANRNLALKLAAG